MKAAFHAKAAWTMNEEPNALDLIRREMDEIDTQLLALLGARFAATARVKAIKGPAPSPMRPGREAAILRRLCEAEAPGVPVALRATLWRGIISTSTLAQAPLRIHLASGLFNSVEARLMVRDHFGPAPVLQHASEEAVLESLAGHASDLAVVAFDGTWASALIEGRAGKAVISGVLPFLSSGAPPRLAVVGHALAEPTGADETLVATNGQLPRDFAPAPLWQVQQGRLRLSSLPGYLDEHTNPLLGVMRTNGTLGLKVLGRFASPIDIPS